MGSGPFGGPYVLVQFIMYLIYCYSAGCSKFLCILHTCMCHTVWLPTMVRLDGSVIADQLLGRSITRTALHQQTLPLCCRCKNRVVGKESVMKIASSRYVGSGDWHGACQ